MNLSASHLKRYKDIASLLWRYGRSDLAKQMQADNTFETEETVPIDPDGAPERLAKDLEGMGPTYVKIGQVLAGRPDLMPLAYRQALARLQDDVKPFAYEEVERIVEREIGARISKAFSRFDREPIAAASLGQVHSAALRDGRAVVVKVQRPDIRPQIAEDFEVLAQIARLLDRHTDAGRRMRFSSTLEEFRTTIAHELDYEREAQNLITVAENLREFDLIVVPQPISDYSTKSVLTMEYIDGRKISKFGPLDRLETDGSVLTRQIFQAYLKQILTDGLFHADPHPGNVFITHDNKIALLDLGMVGRTSPGMQDKLIKLLIAMSEGKGEDAAEVALDISEKVEGFDSAEFRRRITKLVASHRDEGLQRMNVGQSLLELVRDARETGLYVPSELVLLGKTLLQLDEVGRILDPTFDPNAEIRRNVGELMARRARQDMNQGSVFGSLLEMKNFVGGLPMRVNRIMDAAANGGLEVKVKVPDTSLVIEAMQKIANRITAGIVLAALIVGAALLMRVQTRFELWGYPGLAILCFITAAGGAMWLLAEIFVHDRRARRKGA